MIDMPIKKIKLLCICSSLIFSLPVLQAQQAIVPVTKNASPESVQLLQFISRISGKQTLAGQHCVPMVGSDRLPGIQKQFSVYPAVFGQDFGFSPPGTWDGINFRQRIVDEAIRRSNEGFIITLMWHAVLPTENEPVEFKPSIQGELSDKEWQDLVTPGTLLNERWKSQADVIAWFLKQLQYADVPVLWRPYHEMNGDWFWWGKKKGENGYKKLYRMLYDRLVNFHQLHNLVWVFNANEVKEGVDDYATYYPGDDVVDILATDVYTENFNQKNYDQLLALAKNKPIALGEVGRLPSVEVLTAQPRWTWFMLWGDPSGLFADIKAAKATYESASVLTREELPWVKKSANKIHYPILK
jgi:mannan endo-1,4-beta-mannosidase